MLKSSYKKRYIPLLSILIAALMVWVSVRAGSLWSVFWIVIAYAGAVFWCIMNIELINRFGAFIVRWFKATRDWFNRDGLK